MIPKFSVNGISGFLCQECIKFEFIHIKDPGVDKTMQHRHICNPSDLEAALKNPFYRSILPTVELEADENLFLMTKWWLSGKSFLNSLEIGPSEHISHEVYIVNTASDDWLWPYVREKRRQIEDYDLKKFLAMTKATYAVLNFSDKRRFFMLLSR